MPNPSTDIALVLRIDRRKSERWCDIGPGKFECSSDFLSCTHVNQYISSILRILQCENPQVCVAEHKWLLPEDERFSAFCRCSMWIWRCRSSDRVCYIMKWCPQGFHFHVLYYCPVWNGEFQDKVCVIKTEMDDSARTDGGRRNNFSRGLDNTVPYDITAHRPCGPVPPTWSLPFPPRILIIKGIYPREVSLIVIIKQVSSWLSLIIKRFHHFSPNLFKSDHDSPDQTDDRIKI
jgi:hypothetical protein